MKTKTVWKVCNIEDGKFWSTGFHLDLLMLEYVLGQKREPLIENSLLFAFSSPVYAVDYARYNSGASHPTVFRCTADVAVTVCPHIPAFPSLIKPFWRVYARDNYSRDFGRANVAITPPIGTVLCKWIIPIERFV